MSKIFSICNQKGGVGKTTTSVNLSASLALNEKKVLLIDMDPQGNATMGSGLDKHTLDYSLADLLLGENKNVNEIICKANEGYDLLPSNQALTFAEVKLLESDEREMALKNSIKSILGNYDFIIIDCPPSLNILTVNALAISDSVIIPTQCEYYALEGLAALLETIEKIKISVNESLKVGGILRTMYDPRNNLAQDVSSELESYFGKDVLDTIIPRNISLAEAPSHGASIISYDRGCKGSLSYLALAGEIVKISK
ncbi:MAG: ParA family protein [Gammaproteobacteria bacterium]|nr:ParA family protein [Gammaproteobacteria bacterium]MBT7603705.1 ParA family protein [Gammaproteobacteria bacterium]